MVIALVFVEVVNLAIGLLVSRALVGPQLSLLVDNFDAVLRLLFAVGALMLTHNLFAGASAQARAALRWPASGLAIVWIFDLNLYTMAYLGGSWPAEVAALRGLATAVLALLMALTATKGRDELRFRPSRTVTFQTFSLLIIGVYLVAMVATAQWLAIAGGDFARLMELGFLTIASAAALLLLAEPARRADASPYLVMTVVRSWEQLDRRDLAAPLLDRLAGAAPRAHRPIAGWRKIRAITITSRLRAMSSWWRGISARRIACIHALRASAVPTA